MVYFKILIWQNTDFSPGISGNRRGIRRPMRRGHYLAGKSWFSRETAAAPPNKVLRYLLWSSQKDSETILTPADYYCQVIIVSDSISFAHQEKIFHKQETDERKEDN